MSLRARLLLGLVAVAAVGLAVADAATYSALHAFLRQRVDQQLEAARLPLVRELAFEGLRPGPRRALGGRLGARPPRPPTDAYGQVRDARGRVLREATLGEEGAGPPELPRALPGSGSPAQQATFEAPATGDPSFSYRVRAYALPGGGTLVVAVPLRELRQTLRRLVGVEVAVGLGVLVSMGALAWWVIRLGLRPLAHIEETAAHIAAGDLSRRVERAEPRTEVGRLGLSLNAMLAQIERAFAERQASEDRLRRFLADASHELRTPLTSIRGYAELFRRGAASRPADLAKAMERIEQEATRMGVLVEDLLLLARLDQGRPLERGPVDLAAVARDAVADARAVDPSRPLTLQAPEALVVEGDEVRLRQVAANLLANALEHTPPGSPVEVRVATEDGLAVLEVTDHGPGMTPEEAERAFERFYRSDPSRARNSGGAGLGLSIVAAIAQAHGGSVRVRTAPGEGATFRVAIPASGPP